MELFDLYSDKSENENSFKEELISNAIYKKDFDETTFSFEWIEKIEETIRYIDNILRNPNRFIVNEEDIVKIERARRITVESIKHLSKNTNYIQEFEKETGEVKPAKILNINKEESYNTYENRFIYSLIQNMKMYVDIKKRALERVNETKNDRSINYKATTKLGGEKYNIEINIDSSLVGGSNGSSLSEINERIKKVENKIKDLTSTEVYKTIEKLRVSLVTSPIKKTNLILKNTNFQYAVNLWNYLQSNVENDLVNNKDSKEEKVSDKNKKLLDDSFYLNYLILKGSNETLEKDKREISINLLNNMLERLLDIDVLSQKEIIELIDKYFSVVKYETLVNDKEIQEIFKSEIDEYLKKFDNLVTIE